MKNKLFPTSLFVIITLIFFWPFVLQNKLPIPADTIVGMYHPYRDFYTNSYPRGVPFKNSLITDPVRQQYPWKKLAIDQLKGGQLPLWNQYLFSGTPLIANFQSSAFYPLNLLFFIFDFNFAWGIFILLQPLLALVFMYLYLQNLKLDKSASFFGSIAFAFSGFSIAWLEWGNIVHTALWLPLILISIDKIIINVQEIKNNKQRVLWAIIFMFSFSSSFFAGHLQIFFYLFIFSLVYFVLRFFQYGRMMKSLLLVVGSCFLFLVLTFIQWFPAIRFILLSAREIDQVDWFKSGWFIPWQNIVQFIIPDFFGNPATLNYWGVWNYGEFIGFTGVITIVMAVYALFFRRDRKTLFFGTVFFVSLLLVFPTIFAEIPFKLNIPFLSSSQPTRMIFIIDFVLSVLGALGFDYFLKNKKKILYPLGLVGFIFIGIWVFVLILIKDQSLSANLMVSKQNLIYPTLIFVVSAVAIILAKSLTKRKKIQTTLPYILILILIVDLFRFGWKFTPFVKQEYLFPKTKILSFLIAQKGQFRIMATDSRILPPNFSAVYKLQTIDGYDPLYLLRYGEFAASISRDNPDISVPFGFNRIITPQNYASQFVDLLGVKYILSLEKLKDPKLKEVTREGEVKLYENLNVFPKAFFVSKTYSAKNKEDSISTVFNLQAKNELSTTAVVEDFKGKDVGLIWDTGETLPVVLEYADNRIVIKTNNQNDGFMVLTESFYPSWHAKIDGVETKILRTDFIFRGVVVPRGEHIIVFYNQLF